MPHDGGIAEVEKVRPGNFGKVQVLGPEGAVGPRVVQKDPVGAWRGDDDGGRRRGRIATRFRFGLCCALQGLPQIHAGKVFCYSRNRGLEQRRYSL